MRSITICADDYAMNEPVSIAIRHLIELGRLSAVSCMTQSKDWYKHAAKLRPLCDLVDVGLHFDLTHNFDGNNFQNLNVLISKCVLRIADINWITYQLHNQLDRFEHAFGKPPDFIDGHQHVHILPMIRQVLMQELVLRYPNSYSKIWLRRVNPSINKHNSPIKALVLNTLAYNFVKNASEAGFQLSGNLMGVYSFNTNLDYSILMAKWLSNAQNNSLIMCHPGKADKNHQTYELMDARMAEYQYLSSTDFINLCNTQNIKICKLNKNINLELHHCV